MARRSTVSGPLFSTRRFVLLVSSFGTGLLMLVLIMVWWSVTR